LRRVPAGRPGAIDISGAAAAADATRAVLAAARDVGIPVVYVKMEHAPDLSDVGPREGPHWIKHVPLRAGDSVVAPDGSEGRILVRDTWNTAFLDGLAPEPGDPIVSKHRYSVFFETELDDVLRSLGAKSSQPCATRCSATTRASCSRTAQPSRSATARTTPARCA